MNNTLMYIVYIRLVISLFIFDMNIYFDDNTPEQGKEIMIKKVIKIFGLNFSTMTSQQFKMMMNKKFNASLVRFIITLNKISKKYVPGFRFNDFMQEYYPDDREKRAKIVSEYVVNNINVVYNRIHKLTGEYGGIWVASVIKIPVKNKGKFSKLKSLGSDKKGLSKFVLYNLITGEIIPCLNRNKDEIIVLDNCLDPSKINDPNKIIQYTLAKKDFNGLIVMGPRAGAYNYRYMQLFADKLDLSKQQIRIYLDNYTSLTKEQQKIWIMSNLEIFLKYYVEDKLYKPRNGDEEYQMPIAIPYGKGLETTFRKKKVYKTKSKISTFDTTSKMEVQDDKSSMKSAVISWATKGNKNVLNKLNNGLYKSYKKSTQKGFRGITGIVAKNILFHLYDLKVNKHYFTAEDLDKITYYMSSNTQKGGKHTLKLRKDFEKENSQIEQFRDNLLGNISTHNKTIDLKKYYYELLKI